MIISVLKFASTWEKRPTANVCFLHSPTSILIHRFYQKIILIGSLERGLRLSLSTFLLTVTAPGYTAWYHSHKLPVILSFDSVQCSATEVVHFLLLIFSLIKLHIITFLFFFVNVKICIINLFFLKHYWLISYSCLQYMYFFYNALCVHISFFPFLLFYIFLLLYSNSLL